MKNIVLKFYPSHSGAEDQNLTLTYQAGHDHDIYTVDTTIEYPTDTIKAYKKWQREYDNLLDVIDTQNKQNYSVIESKSQNNETIRAKVLLSFEECTKTLNTWFENLKINEDSLFKKIEHELITSGTSQVKLVIQTEDKDLQKLFWNRLTILTDSRFRDRTGIVYSLLNTRSSHRENNKINDKILRILVIYGDGEDELELAEELKIFLQWNENKANSSWVQVIKAPDCYEDLITTFTEERWDIIYFTGHGTHYPIEIIQEPCQEYSEQIIKICNKQISVEQFCTLLEHNNPYLKLVILSCCDGLELAKKLLEKSVPQIIYIREKITPKTSVNFLKFFLEEFKKEPCLHISLHKAQSRLYVHNTDEPGASSIMALLQLPNTEHLEWHPPRDIIIEEIHKHIFYQLAKQHSKKNIVFAIIVGSLGLIVMGALVASDLIRRYQPQRTDDSLQYTFDIFEKDMISKQQTRIGTGYFVDKEKNIPLRDSKNFTYTVVVPETVKRIMEDKRKSLIINTLKEAGVQLAVSQKFKEYVETPVMEFKSNMDYSFPEFEVSQSFPQLFQQSLLSELVTNNNIFIFKIDAKTNEIFDKGFVCKLVSKSDNDLDSRRDRKYTYYGYVHSKSLAKFLDSGNAIEIQTLKGEKLRNDMPQTGQETSSLNNQAEERGFNPHVVRDRDIVIFSFSSDLDYEFEEVFHNVKELEDIAKKLK